MHVQSVLAGSTVLDDDGVASRDAPELRALQFLSKQVKHQLDVQHPGQPRSSFAIHKINQVSHVASTDCYRYEHLRLEGYRVILDACELASQELTHVPDIKQNFSRDEDANEHSQWVSLLYHKWRQGEY